MALKAKKLFDTFLMKVLDRDGTSAMNEFEVKQCALIAVDEMINLYNEMNADGLLKPNSIGFNLSELKQEIENL